MIVDDEKQILDGLSKMIKWSEFDFEVCGTTRSGSEAIPLIKSRKPDLVLTDIRMPKMDGLELLQYVREKISADIEFIIISGYGDFEYAQKAIRYNVKNYILKPIDEAKMYASLVDIKNGLREKELRNSLMIKSYINNIINGDKTNTPDISLEDEEKCGLRYITIERRHEFTSLFSREDPRRHDGLLGMIVRKIGKANMRFVSFQGTDKCHIVAGQTLLRCFEYSVEYFAQRLFNSLWISNSVPIDISIGKKVDGFRKLYESIQSIDMCRYKLFYTREPSIIMYESVRDDKICKLFDDNGAVVRVISAFRKNDANRMSSAIRELINHFAQFLVVPEIALIHLDSIMASIIQILSERIDDTQEILELYSIYKKIQNHTNIYDLGRLVIEFCLFCGRFSSFNENSQKLNSVRKIALYVDAHYMEQLKISDIAKRFFMNPAYLGQQFIKHKGCSLNHYINSVRLEKSKDLLANTNLKVYEIAKKVGFDDPNYFSFKFFEYTSQTPSDYRRGRFSQD